MSVLGERFSREVSQTHWKIEYRIIEKRQKDKQQFTKHTHKTKDRVTRTPLITGG
jgi:hypothetical protein